eukprot:TRINITY_DN12053_c0_g1_i1.p1 TRINITY_DN12053_c0_g1~~TRINITY_DN12053_c0_g1_i1.p1  ORF type:complete len:106 (+),score=19.03 TRINITY_DN12053_c0_g1_i1:182-499(+)
MEKTPWGGRNRAGRTWGSEASEDDWSSMQELSDSDDDEFKECGSSSSRSTTTSHETHTGPHDFMSSDPSSAQDASQTGCVHEILPLFDSSAWEIVSFMSFHNGEV